MDELDVLKISQQAVLRMSLKSSSRRLVLSKSQVTRELDNRGKQIIRR
jgi:hypothetical protein